MKSIIYLSITICLLIQTPSINSYFTAVLLPQYNAFDYRFYKIQPGQMVIQELPADTAISTILQYSVLPDYVHITPFANNTVKAILLYGVPESFLTWNASDCLLYKIEEVVDISVCESSSASVTNSWCKTYCTFETSGSCTGVASHMSSICECSSVSRAAKLSRCKSLNAGVSNNWCSSYCHFDSSNVCSVDAHMSNICACSNP